MFALILWLTLCLCVSKWVPFQVALKTAIQGRKLTEGEDLWPGRCFWVLSCHLFPELPRALWEDFSAGRARRRSGHLLNVVQGFWKSLGGGNLKGSSMCLQSAVLLLFVAEIAWPKWGKIQMIAEKKVWILPLPVARVVASEPFLPVAF